MTGNEVSVRRDQPAHSHRLFHCKHAIPWDGGRDRVSIRPWCFLAEPLKETRGIIHLALGVCKWFAVLPGTVSQSMFDIIRADDSSHINLAKSSTLSSINWYHRLSILDRSLAVVFLNVGKASAAACMAIFVSFLSISGIFPIASPVAGSVTSNVLPDLADTHCPFTYAFSLNRDLSASCGTL